MTEQTYPPGWNQERTKSLIEQYNQMSEEDFEKEDELASDGVGQTVISVPSALLPAIRQLLASHQHG